MTDDREADAAHRRERAEQRAAELRELGDRLRSGDQLTQADVDLARRRAEEAVRYDVEAHERAATAHARSADRHRQAAEVAQRAGLADRAAEHLGCADSDDESARRERAAAQPGGAR